MSLPLQHRATGRARAPVQTLDSFAGTSRRLRAFPESLLTCTTRRPTHTHARRSLTPAPPAVKTYSALRLPCTLDADAYSASILSPSPARLMHHMNKCTLACMDMFWTVPLPWKWDDRLTRRV